MIDLLNKIRPYLTNFLNNEIVFKKAFEENAIIRDNIKNVLELGVHHGENPMYGGQSTKAFYWIYNEIGYENLYSLDLAEECSHTIELIKEMFLAEEGAKIPPHHFIIENSIEYSPDIKFDFIFLDTNHDSICLPVYHGEAQHGGEGFTFQEITKYTNLLTPNGRFFLHDTKEFYADKKLGFNVEGAIVKFIRENNNWAFIEHNTNQHGLGELINIDSDVYKYNDLYHCWYELYFKPINEKY